jgi:radical SAM protein with 4Fe4S-binding SPASM domain
MARLDFVPHMHKDYLPKPCFSCPQMGQCDGGCCEAVHVIGGSPDAVDPLLLTKNDRTNQICP